MDGWSLPILIGELLSLYAGGGDLEALPPVPPYAEYLAWLAAQDREAARAAWRDALADLDGGTFLAPAATRDLPATGAPHRRETVLTAELTARLEDLARLAAAGVV